MNRSGRRGFGPREGSGDLSQRVAARRAASHRKRARRRRFTALAALLLGLAAVLFAVLRTGGGGGSERGGTGPLRWLTASSGSPPSIAEENAKAGSSGWTLSAHPQKGGPVEGYLSSQDLLAGRPERLYVNTPGARRVRVRIFRMGYYGGAAGRLVAASRPLAAGRQPPCRHVSESGLTECHWRPTLSFRVPPTLPSGVYIVRMDRGASARECIFVLESEHPTPLVAQLPTATYEAYNDWGGDSLYPGGSDQVGATGTNQGVEVSFDRPYDTPSGAGLFFQLGDLSMIRFLERHGYPVSYTTPASLDRSPGQLSGARMALDIGHSEYWSAAQRQAFERARERGTNLAFLSSDTLAWRIRFLPASPASSEAGSPGHRIASYKEFSARDPEHHPVRFSDLGASLTGSAYENCITPRIPPGTAAIYHYYPWRVGPTLHPAWLFRGSGFVPGAEVPGIVGYELDQLTAKSPHGLTVVGSGTTPCLGRGPGSAVSTLYRAPSGALVFASGTLGWQFGLEPSPAVSPDVPHRPDPRLSRLTENLFSKMLGAP